MSAVPDLQIKVRLSRSDQNRLEIPAQTKTDLKGLSLDLAIGDGPINFEWVPQENET